MQYHHEDGYVVKDLEAVKQKLRQTNMAKQVYFNGNYERKNPESKKSCDLWS